MSIDTVLLKDGTWGVRVYGNDVTLDDAHTISRELTNAFLDAHFLNREADRLTNYAADRHCHPILTFAQYMAQQTLRLKRDAWRLNQRLNSGTWS